MEMLHGARPNPAMQQQITVHLPSADSADKSPETLTVPPADAPAAVQRHYQALLKHHMVHAPGHKAVSEEMVNLVQTPVQPVVSTDPPLPQVRTYTGTHTGPDHPCLHYQMTSRLVSSSLIPLPASCLSCVLCVEEHEC